MNINIFNVCSNKLNNSPCNVWNKSQHEYVHHLFLLDYWSSVLFLLHTWLQLTVSALRCVTINSPCVFPILQSKGSIWLMAYVVSNLHLRCSHSETPPYQHRCRCRCSVITPPCRFCHVLFSPVIIWVVWVPLISPFLTIGTFCSSYKLFRLYELLGRN